MSAGEGWGLGATGPVGGGGVFHLSDTDKEDERGLSLRPRVRGYRLKGDPLRGIENMAAQWSRHPGVR